MSCQASQVEISEAKRAIALIEQFAAAYSPSTLRDHLTDIYLVGSLDCNGKKYGGTNSNSAIYLRVDAESQGYDAHYLLSILHAEFSSILLREHTFPVQEWEALNPPGFEYSNNALFVLEEPGITDRPSPELFCGGLLSRYAASDLEEDFNEYAGAILVEPEELCAYHTGCTAIAAKTSLAIEFYKSVDPGINVPSCESAAKQPGRTDE